MSLAGPLPRYAIALSDRLRIRDRPGTAGQVLAVVKLGDVLTVTGTPALVDQADWYPVQNGIVTAGWVSAGTDGHPNLDLRFPASQMEPASLVGVAAGASGFLAWGTRAYPSNETARPLLVASSDGGTWQAVELPDSVASILDAAWGPDGWLLVTSDQTDATHCWRSADGFEWAELPAFGHAAVKPADLHASRDGYLLLTTNRSTSYADYFRSVDGATWQEVTEPGLYGLVPEIDVDAVAIPSGYLRWSTDGTTTAFDASTDNGADWRPVLGDLPAVITQLAMAGPDLFAVGTEPTGDQSVWRAALAATTLEWERLSIPSASVAGDDPIRLVSDGQDILASGYASDGSPHFWLSRDGATWTDIQVPGLLGWRSPELRAGGPRGFIAVGTVFTLVGSNPVMWHSADGKRWSGEQNPVAVTRHAVVGVCPARPTTYVDWDLLPPAVAVDCFADTPITFRAWRTVSDIGCGGTGPAVLPGWLGAMFAESALVLTPYEAETDGCGGSAAREPDASPFPAPEEWVIATGHFDDSASGTCRFVDPTQVSRDFDPRTLVLDCRETFVATSVVPAK